MSAQAGVLCVCGKTIQPERRWFTSPKQVACPHCSFVIRIDVGAPANSEACFTMAEDCAEARDYERAIGLTSLGLAKAPASAHGHFVRAYALDKLGKSPFTVLDWSVCISAAYRVAGATLKRAQAYKEIKDYANALKDYNRLLDGDLADSKELQNKFCRVTLERAGVFCNTGDFARALQDYDRLLEGDLRSRREREKITKYEILDARGVAFCRAGRYDEARADLNAVLPHSSPGGMISYWLLVCQYRGDETRAMTEWSKT